MRTSYMEAPSGLCIAQNDPTPTPWLRWKDGRTTNWLKRDGRVKLSRRRRRHVKSFNFFMACPIKGDCGSFSSSLAPRIVVSGPAAQDPHCSPPPRPRGDRGIQGGKVFVGIRSKYGLETEGISRRGGLCLYRLIRACSKGGSSSFPTEWNAI